MGDENRQQIIERGRKQAEEARSERAIVNELAHPMQCGDVAAQPQLFLKIVERVRLESVARVLEQRRSAALANKILVRIRVRQLAVKLDSLVKII